MIFKLSLTIPHFREYIFTCLAYLYFDQCVNFVDKGYRTAGPETFLWTSWILTGPSRKIWLNKHLQGFKKWYWMAEPVKAKVIQVWRENEQKLHVFCMLILTH